MPLLHRLNWLFLAAALLGFALPASAAPQPGAVQALQSAPPAEHARGAGKGKLARLFTREQRAMFMLDARRQVKGMTREQRRAWRKDQIQKILAMSPTQRQAFQSNLQARWDALPVDRKNRIEQRLATRETPPPAR